MCFIEPNQNLALTRFWLVSVDFALIGCTVSSLLLCVSWYSCYKADSLQTVIVNYNAFNVLCFTVSGSTHQASGSTTLVTHSSPQGGHTAHSTEQGGHNTSTQGGDSTQHTATYIPPTANTYQQNSQQVQADSFLSSLTLRHMPRHLRAPACFGQ